MAMGIKIENQVESRKIPARTEEIIQNIVATVPREHIRGIERLKLVDVIKDSRVRLPQKSSLPGLYHPKQGSQPAWVEIALDVLLPRGGPFYKKLMPRLSFKANLAAVIFSLVGQHYYQTMRHSVKKTQLETSVRLYAEKQLKSWSTKENRLRTRLFKPFQPALERWARSLQKRAKESKKG